MDGYIYDKHTLHTKCNGKSKEEIINFLMTELKKLDKDCKFYLNYNRSRANIYLMDEECRECLINAKKTPLNKYAGMNWADISSDSEEDMEPINDILFEAARFKYPSKIKNKNVLVCENLPKWVSKKILYLKFKTFSNVPDYPQVSYDITKNKAQITYSPECDDSAFAYLMTNASILSCKNKNEKILKTNLKISFE